MGAQYEDEYIVRVKADVTEAVGSINDLQKQFTALDEDTASKMFDTLNQVMSMMTGNAKAVPGLPMMSRTDGIGNIGDLPEVFQSYMLSMMTTVKNQIEQMSKITLDKSNKTEAGQFTDVAQTMLKQITGSVFANVDDMLKVALNARTGTNGVSTLMQKDLNNSLQDMYRRATEIIGQTYSAGIGSMEENALKQVLMNNKSFQKGINAAAQRYGLDKQQEESLISSFVQMSAPIYRTDYLRKYAQHSNKAVEQLDNLPEFTDYRERMPERWRNISQTPSIDYEQGRRRKNYQGQLTQEQYDLVKNIAEKNPTFEQALRMAGLAYRGISDRTAGVLHMPKDAISKSDYAKALGYMYKDILIPSLEGAPLNYKPITTKDGYIQKKFANKTSKDINNVFEAFEALSAIGIDPLFASVHSNEGIKNSVFKNGAVALKDSHVSIKPNQYQIMSLTLDDFVAGKRPMPDSKLQEVFEERARGTSTYKMIQQSIYTDLLGMFGNKTYGNGSKTELGKPIILQIDPTKSVYQYDKNGDMEWDSKGHPKENKETSAKIAEMFKPTATLNYSRNGQQYEYKYPVIENGEFGRYVPTNIKNGVITLAEEQAYLRATQRSLESFGVNIFDNLIDTNRKFETYEQLNKQLEARNRLLTPGVPIESIGGKTPNANQFAFVDMKSFKDKNGVPLLDGASFFMPGYIPGKNALVRAPGVKGQAQSVDYKQMIRDLFGENTTEFYMPFINAPKEMKELFEKEGIEAVKKAYSEKGRSKDFARDFLNVMDYDAIISDSMLKSDVYRDFDNNKGIQNFFANNLKQIGGLRIAKTARDFITAQTSLGAQMSQMLHMTPEEASANNAMWDTYIEKLKRDQDFAIKKVFPDKNNPLHAQIQQNPGIMWQNPLARSELVSAINSARQSQLRGELFGDGDLLMGMASINPAESLLRFGSMNKLKVRNKKLADELTLKDGEVSFQRLMGEGQVSGGRWPASWTEQYWLKQADDYLTYLDKYGMSEDAIYTNMKTIAKMGGGDVDGDTIQMLRRNLARLVLNNQEKRQEQLGGYTGTNLKPDDITVNRSQNPNDFADLLYRQVAQQIELGIVSNASDALSQGNWNDKNWVKSTGVAGVDLKQLYDIDSTFMKTGVLGDWTKAATNARWMGKPFSSVFKNLMGVVENQDFSKIGDFSKINFPSIYSAQTVSVLNSLKDNPIYSESIETMLRVQDVLQNIPELLSSSDPVKQAQGNFLRLNNQIMSRFFGGAQIMADADLDSLTASLGNWSGALRSAELEGNLSDERKEELKRNRNEYNKQMARIKAANQFGLVERRVAQGEGYSKLVEGGRLTNEISPFEASYLKENEEQRRQLSIANANAAVISGSNPIVIGMTQQIAENAARANLMRRADEGFSSKGTGYSWTQLNLFENNPEEWYRRYIQGDWSRAEKSKETEIGSAFHNTMQLWGARRIKNDEDYGTADEYEKIAWQMMMNNPLIANHRYKPTGKSKYNLPGFEEFDLYSDQDIEQFKKEVQENKDLRFTMGQISRINNVISSARALPEFLKDEQILGVEQHVSPLLGMRLLDPNQPVASTGAIDILTQRKNGEIIYSDLKPVLSYAGAKDQIRYYNSDMRASKGRVIAYNMEDKPLATSEFDMDKAAVDQVVAKKMHDVSMIQRFVEAGGNFAMIRDGFFGMTPTRQDSYVDRIIGQRDHREAEIEQSKKDKEMSKYQQEDWEEGRKELEKKTGISMAKAIALQNDITSYTEEMLKLDSKFRSIIGKKQPNNAEDFGQWGIYSNQIGEFFQLRRGELKSRYATDAELAALDEAQRKAEGDYGNALRISAVEDLKTLNQDLTLKQTDAGTKNIIKEFNDLNDSVERASSAYRKFKREMQDKDGNIKSTATEEEIKALKEAEAEYEKTAGLKQQQVDALKKQASYYVDNELARITGASVDKDTLSNNAAFKKGMQISQFKNGLNLLRDNGFITEEQYNQYAASVDKIDLNKYQKQYGEYLDKFKNRQESYLDYNSLQQTTQAERYETQIDQQLRQWNNRGMTDALSRNLMQRYTMRDQLNNSASNASLQIAQAKARIADAEATLKNPDATSDQKTAAQANYDAATASLQHYERALTNTQNALKQFQHENGQFRRVANPVAASIDTIAQAGDRMVQAFGRKLFRQAFQEAKNFVVQFDSQMRSIQAITMKTDEEMEEVRARTIDRAIELRTSVANVAQVEADLYRQGLDDTQVEERADAIVKFATVTGAKVTDAGKAITTAIQNGLVGSATEAMDVLTALGDSAATTANEIFKGMQKSAAAAKVAGVSYDELTTLLTIGTSKTQMSGQVLGTGLQTIFSRINRVTNQGYVNDETGASVTINDVEKALSSAGISVREGDGKSFRNSFDVLRDLSKVWQDLNDLQRSNITYTMAGGRQTNIFQSLMEGMSEDGGTELDRLLGLAANSEGTTESKYEIAVKSISASLEELKATYDGLVDSISSDGFITGTIDGITSIVGGLKDLSDSTPGIVTGITAIGTAIAGLAVKFALLNAVKGGAAGLISTLGMLAAGGTVLALAAAAGGITKMIEDSKNPDKQYEEEKKVKEEQFSNQKKNASVLQERIDKVKELGEAWENSNKNMKDSEETKNLQAALDDLCNHFDGLDKRINKNKDTLANWRDFVNGAQESVDHITRESARAADETDKYMLYKKSKQIVDDYQKTRVEEADKYAVSDIANYALYDAHQITRTVSRLRSDLQTVTDQESYNELLNAFEEAGLSSVIGSEEYSQEQIEYLKNQMPVIAMSQLLSGIQYKSPFIDFESDTVKWLQNRWNAYYQSDFARTKSFELGYGADFENPSTWSPDQWYGMAQGLIDFNQNKAGWLATAGNDTYKQQAEQLFVDYVKSNNELGYIFKGNEAALSKLAADAVKDIDFDKYKDDESLLGPAISNMISNIIASYDNDPEWFKQTYGLEDYKTQIKYRNPQNKNEIISFGTNETDLSEERKQELAQEHYQQWQNVQEQKTAKPVETKTTVGIHIDATFKTDNGVEAKMSTTVDSGADEVSTTESKEEIKEKEDEKQKQDEARYKKEAEQAHALGTSLDEMSLVYGDQSPVVKYYKDLIDQEQQQQYQEQQLANIQKAKEDYSIKYGYPAYFKHDNLRTPKYYEELIEKIKGYGVDEDHYLDVFSDEGFADYLNKRRYASQNTLTSEARVKEQIDEVKQEKKLRSQERQELRQQEERQKEKERQEALKDARKQELNEMRQEKAKRVADRHPTKPEELVELVPEEAPPSILDYVSSKMSDINKQDLTNSAKSLLSVAQTVNNISDLNKAFGNASILNSLINQDVELTKMFDSLDKNESKYSWDDVLEHLRQTALGSTLDTLATQISGTAYSYDQQRTALSAVQNGTATSEQINSLLQQYGIDGNVFQNNKGLYISLEQQRLNRQKTQMENNASQLFTDMMDNENIQDRLNKLNAIAIEQEGGISGRERFGAIWNAYVASAADKERLQTLMDDYKAQGYTFEMDANGKVVAHRADGTVMQENVLDPFEWNRRNVSRAQTLADVRAVLAGEDTSQWSPERQQAVASYSSEMQQYINLSKDLKDKEEGNVLRKKIEYQIEIDGLQDLVELGEISQEAASAAENLAKGGAFRFDALNSIRQSTYEISQLAGIINASDLSDDMISQVMSVLKLNNRTDFDANKSQYMQEFEDYLNSEAYRRQLGNNYNQTIDKAVSAEDKKRIREEAVRLGGRLTKDGIVFNEGWYQGQQYQEEDPLSSYKRSITNPQTLQAVQQIIDAGENGVNVYKTFSKEMKDNVMNVSGMGDYLKDIEKYGEGGADAFNKLTQAQRDLAKTIMQETVGALEAEGQVISGLSGQIETMIGGNIVDSVKQLNELSNQMTEMANMREAYSRLIKGGTTSQEDWDTFANFWNMSEERKKQYRTGKRSLAADYGEQVKETRNLESKSVRTAVEQLILSGVTKNGLVEEEVKPKNFIEAVGQWFNTSVLGKPKQTTSRPVTAAEAIGMMTPEQIAQKNAELEARGLGARINDNGEIEYISNPDKQLSFSQMVSDAIDLGQGDTRSDYELLLNYRNQTGDIKSFQRMASRAKHLGLFKTNILNDLVNNEDYLAAVRDGNEEDLTNILLQGAYGITAPNQTTMETEGVSGYLSAALQGNKSELEGLAKDSTKLNFMTQLEGFEDVYKTVMSGQDLKQYQIKALKGGAAYQMMYEMEREGKVLEGSANAAKIFATGPDATGAFTRQQQEALSSFTEEYKRYGEVQKIASYITQNAEKVEEADWKRLQEEGKYTDKQIDDMKKDSSKLQAASDAAAAQQQRVKETLMQLIRTLFQLGDLSGLSDEAKQALQAAVDNLFSDLNMEVKRDENGNPTGLEQEEQTPWEILNGVVSKNGTFKNEYEVGKRRIQMAEMMKDAGNLEEFERMYKLAAEEMENEWMRNDEKVSEVFGQDFSNFIQGAREGQITNAELINSFIQSSGLAPLYQDQLFNNNLAIGQNLLGSGFGLSEDLKATAEQQSAFYDYISTHSQFANWLKEFEGGAELIQSASGPLENFAKGLKTFNAEISSAKTKQMNRWGSATGEVSGYVKDLNSSAASAAKAIGTLTSKAAKLGQQGRAAQNARGKSGKNLDKDTASQFGSFFGLDENAIKQMAAEDMSALSDIMEQAAKEEFETTVGATIAEQLIHDMEDYIKGTDLTMEGLKIKFDTNKDGSLDMSEVSAACQEMQDYALAELASYVGTIGELVLQITSSGDKVTAEAILNAFKGGKTGGGGGGGGGGGKSKAQKLIEELKREQTLKNHQIKMIQYQETKYENAGEITNQNKMIELENEAQKDLIKTLEEHIKKTKEQMAQTKKDSDDWHSLRESILQYEEAIEEANNAIDENTKKIKENQQAILKQRTDLEEMVFDVLENRKQRERDMLSGTVSMQDTILEAIRQRYRDEWALIEKDIDKKREALEESKNLIDEELQKRKDAEDEAERYEEIQEYKRQLALIEMDSTRTKDAAKLRKQIEDLEKERAWGMAEDEAEYAKEQIDDQLKAYDDFTNYGAEDLEDFLADANNLSNEVNQVMQLNQEGIMDWLKNNVKEYADSMEAAKKQMLNGWEDMYIQMVGYTETYMDEIARILSDKDLFIETMMSDLYDGQGNLTVSDADLQQLLYQWNEAYDLYQAALLDYAEYMHTDEWERVSKGGGTQEERERYEEIGKKVKEAAEKFYESQISFQKYMEKEAKVYDLPHAPFDQNGIITAADKTNKMRNNAAIAEELGLSNDKVYNWTNDSLLKEAPVVAPVVVSPERQKLDLQEQKIAPNEKGVSVSPSVMSWVDRKYQTNIPVNDEGGLVDYTGLAWVDGTLTKPEAFLDAEDTQLIRGFLDEAKYVHYRSAVSNIDSSSYSGNSQSIGELVINITEAQFKDDADFDEVANKVGEKFVKELAKQGIHTMSYSF